MGVGTDKKPLSRQEIELEIQKINNEISRRWRQSPNFLRSQEGMEMSQKVSYLQSLLRPKTPPIQNPQPERPIPRKRSSYSNSPERPQALVPSPKSAFAVLL